MDLDYDQKNAMLFRKATAMFAEITLKKEFKSDREKAEYLSDYPAIFAICLALCLSYIDGEESVKDIISSSYEKSLFFWRLIRDEKAKNKKVDLSREL